MSETQKNDHGGGVDSAVLAYGGQRSGWIDLSTGINPHPYPVGAISPRSWSDLPDTAAQTALIHAARRFWHVPSDAAVLATHGASAPIALIPHLAPKEAVHVAAPTYNEHATAFKAAGWHWAETAKEAQAQVIVHPNNPDGRMFTRDDLHAPLRIIDESFCDVAPDASFITQATQPGTLILKSFGKFWGLAGLRLGFVIGDPALIARLEQMLGPWPVAGPALEIAAKALGDTLWADQTRTRLQKDATRLDAVLAKSGAKTLGGTTLFRLYEVSDATAWQARLAKHHIWSRVFPYNPKWLRLGLPSADQWARVEDAFR